MIHHRVVELVAVHTGYERLEIIFRFQLDADQGRPRFFVVFLNEFKPHDVVCRSQDLVHELLQRSGALRKAHNEIMF